jgi:hypothetical protein
VTGDANGVADIFVRSLALNITRRVSVGTSGDQGNQTSTRPTINADGLAVAFDTRSALSPLDRNGVEDVYLNDARIPLETLNLVRGVIESGGYNSVLHSDDSHFVLRPGITFTTSQAPIELVVEATGPSPNPTRLEFAIEFHSTAPAIRQTIEMYNFGTNAYENVDTRQSTLTDSVAVVAITSNAGRFVSPTGLMRSRMSYKATGPVFAYPWRTRIDYIRWTVF